MTGTYMLLLKEGNDAGKYTGDFRAIYRKDWDHADQWKIVELLTRKYHHWGYFSRPVSLELEVHDTDAVDEYPDKASQVGVIDLLDEKDQANGMRHRIGNALARLEITISGYEGALK